MPIEKKTLITSQKMEGKNKNGSKGDDRDLVIAVIDTEIQGINIIQA